MLLSVGRRLAIEAMIALTILTAALVAGQEQETKTFKDEELGLSFQYPAEWSFRQERLYSVFDIPMSTGSTAECRIIHTNFQQDRQVWQDIQKEIAISMERRVDRQWQEVILGVPMLMTRLGYSQAGADKVTLVGLLYSSSAQKLNFRLSSSVVDAPEAEKAWRSTLNSLRTTSGQLPEIQDPNSTSQGSSNAGAAEEPEDDGSLTLTPKSNEAVQKKKGSEVWTAFLDSKPVSIYAPKGWTFTKADKGWTVTHDKVSGKLMMTIHAGTDADARASVVKASIASSSRFKSISVRDEPRPRNTKAGAKHHSISRRGASDVGSLALDHLAGWRGDIYWRIDYEGGENAKNDVKQITKLIDLLAVEPPQ
jgi:hypothetical protein